MSMVPEGMPTEHNWETEDKILDIPLRFMVINRRRDPDIPESYSVIGKSGLRRVDGWDKASGKAAYPRDMSSPGMLYARILESPYPNAIVKSIDSSAAEALPGVRYVLRCDDSDFMVQYVLTAHPLFEGEPCAVAVVADSEEIAEEGLRLCKIEWETLPFVLTAEESLQPDAPSVLNTRHPYRDRSQDPTVNEINGTFAGSYCEFGEIGDIEAGFQEADQIIEYDIHREENIASCPSRANLQVWGIHGSGQTVGGGPFSISESYQSFYGGFGAMIQHVPLGLLGPILAQRTGRDVLTVTPASQDGFYAAADDKGWQHFKVGFKNDGTITAVQLDTLYDSTGFQNGIAHIAGFTSIKNTLVNYKAAWTNGPIYGPNRSELRFNTQAMSILFGKVAAELDMDPTELSLMNNGYEGHDVQALMQWQKDHGHPERDSLQECVDAGKAVMDWDNKWHAPGAKQLENGKMHGLGFCWDHNWSSIHENSNVSLFLKTDGKLTITAHHAEHGCDALTTMCMLAAESTGLKYEDVYIRPGYNYDGFTLQSGGGSASMSTNAWSIQRAGRELKPQILKAAVAEHAMEPTYDGFQHPELAVLTSAFPGLEWTDLDIKDSVVFEKANPDNSMTVAEVLGRTIVTSLFGQTIGPIHAWGCNTDGMYGAEHDRPTLNRQAMFVEVEVDTETGMVELLHGCAVNDVGRVVRPEGCYGQQVGGYIMGMGRSQMYEVVYDQATGVRMNTNLLDYKYPTMNDFTNIEAVPIETEMGFGAWGVVGVAENASDLMSSPVANAIYNATGVWVLDFPLTPAKVLKALGKA